jgi:hypothetical protein
MPLFDPNLSREKNGVFTQMKSDKARNSNIKKKEVAVAPTTSKPTRKGCLVYRNGQVKQAE